MTVARLLSSLLLVGLVATGIAVARGSQGEPQTEATWSVAGELSRTRAYARAVALETGEILIVGGLDKHDAGVTIATTEVFDPRTRRSTVLPQRVLGRINQQATAAWGGRVIVTGGTEWVGGLWSSVSRVDVYLPWSRQWLAGASMLQPRSDHGATSLLDGRVLVAGGNDDARILRSAEIYDPTRDVWAPAEPMPRARTQFSIATLPDGSVLVAGGFQGDGLMTRTTLLYEPRVDRWIEGPQMGEVRLNHSMVKLPNGDLLFFGGEGPAAGTAERYSWRERGFVHAGVLGEPRLVAQGALLPDGRVIAVGGLSQDRTGMRFIPSRGVEWWEPRALSWHVLPDALTRRAYAQLIATDAGLFRFSGVGEDEDAFSTVEELVWR